MATNKRAFTLRLSDEIFDQIGKLAISNHRSVTNYIEYILIKHLEELESSPGLSFPAKENDDEPLYRKVPIK